VAPVRTVELVLDARVRRVWVDGQQVDERPVRVRLDAERVVEAQGSGGARVRRVIPLDAPDEVPITLPRVGGAPPQTKKESSPLLGSPYHRKRGP
jgi:hypothetical protein